MLSSGTIVGLISGYFIKVIFDFFKYTISSFNLRRKKIKMIIFELDQIISDIDANSKLQITVKGPNNASVPNFAKLKFFSIERYIDLLVENNCGKSSHRLIDNIHAYNRSIELSYSVLNFAAANPQHLHSLNAELLAVTNQLKESTMIALSKEPLIYRLLIRAAPFLVFLYPSELNDK